MALPVSSCSAPVSTLRFFFSPSWPHSCDLREEQKRGARKVSTRRFATKIGSGLRDRSLHSHENEFELFGVVTLSSAAHRYDLPLFRYASFHLSAEFDRGSACSGASTRRRGFFYAAVQIWPN